MLSAQFDYKYVPGVTFTLSRTWLPISVSRVNLNLSLGLDSIYFELPSAESGFQRFLHPVSPRCTSPSLEHRCLYLDEPCMVTHLSRRVRMVVGPWRLTYGELILVVGDKLDDRHTTIGRHTRKSLDKTLTFWSECVNMKLNVKLRFEQNSLGFSGSFLPNFNKAARIAQSQRCPAPSSAVWGGERTYIR